MGLHCCGELSPTVLEIFASQCHHSLHCLLLIPCCYHKMVPSLCRHTPSHSGHTPSHNGYIDPSHSGHTSSHGGHTSSHNGHTPSHSGHTSHSGQTPPNCEHTPSHCGHAPSFPLSRAGMSLLGHKKLHINSFGLRLAAQDSAKRSTWLLCMFVCQSFTLLFHRC